MADSITWRNGKRGWLTLGAVTVALVGGLVTQLPSASASPSRVRALTEQAPTVVDPSPQVGPDSGVDAPVGPTAPAVATPVESTAPSAAPTPPPAPVAKPAKAPKPVAAPKRSRAPFPRRVPTAKPVTAPASGDTCSGSGWQAARGSRALASLRHPTPSGVSVSFKGARSGYLGLTYPAQRHVDMFVRSCSAESWALLRHVMAHEMGHAYDAAHMTTASRAAYMAMRGIPAGTPWFGCAYCTDFATPAGDFAETYSQWQRGTSDSRSRMAPAPGPAALARIGAAFFSQ
jgi:hypothetical protein